MREGYLSSITGVVDLPPDGVTEGARRATVGATGMVDN